MKRALAAGALLLAGACGGGDDDDDGAPDAGTLERCTPTEQAGVYFDPDDTCRFLSSYRFFVGGGVDLEPNDRVVPYDLTSALYADYATKQRYIYLPADETMAYHDVDSFELPVGAAILKTFGYPELTIETRLLYRAADGWKGLTYLWDEAESEAELLIAGRTVDLGDEIYIVPNTNQCKECHEEVEDVMGPVGPKARYMNRDFDYGAGAENQLAHFADLGMLTGAPADPVTEAPRAPVWDDEADGTLDERARAYIDINCAHCHNPEGRARTSGLDLRASNPDALSYGVCKAPVAAGGGSGGLQYNIVPGQPDASILIYRMESTRPDEQMPELGRTRVHAEAVAVLREWITAMPGSCP
jgi:uncharacterized repeat protein (TIGR03806 family)